MNKESSDADLASIVIPTRDRPIELLTCLDALAPYLDDAFEVVVVDDSRDGSVDAAALCLRYPLVRLEVKRGLNAGPAAARNLGWQASLGGYVLFLDDDVVPCSDWARIAVQHAETSAAVGVEGCTISQPFDPLYEHSAACYKAGGYLSCNILYRRAFLEAVGGFDEGFRFPHAEDRDLGIRMRRFGKIAFSSDMQVEHPVRRVSAAWLVQRARVTVLSDYRLYRKHPELLSSYPIRVPLLAPLIGIFRSWLCNKCHSGVGWRPIVRRIFVGSAQCFVATLVTVYLLMTRKRHFDSLSPCNAPASVNPAHKSE